MIVNVHFLGTTLGDLPVTPDTYLDSVRKNIHELIFTLDNQLSPEWTFVDSKYFIE